MFKMGVIADLSYHQNNIDFAKLSKIADMVILRVQCGSTFIDPRYSSYVAECKKYGIPFGTYAYAKFISVPDAIQEAKDAYNRMDKDSKFMVLDCEEMTLRNPNDIVPAAQAFIDYFKQKGVKIGLYSGQYFYNNYGLSNLRYDFLWIAKYSNNQPSISCAMWQFTSSGHVDGIIGNVDLNKLMGKLLEYFIGKSQASPTQSQQSNKPIMRVRALVKNDIRTAPSHTAGYVRDAIPPEEFDVYEIRNIGGTQWHLIGGEGDKQFWIDGNNGANLFWIDNPNNKITPQPVSHPVHIVAKGETLGKIASANGTTVANLCKLNGIKDPNKISIGQKIILK
jgi:GH25 family lysozyme M1 (1,4-beta-N-acetylmuramidase)